MLGAPVSEQHQPPHTLPAAGQPVLHADASAGQDLDADPGKEVAAPQAILVCHGMGQQLPFDTLQAVADAIALAGNDNFKITEKRVCMVRPGADDKPLVARVELDIDDFGTRRTVHLYEAYWAPLTEGMITYWETAAFLVRSAFNALGSPRDFERWKFGALQKCRSPKALGRVVGALLLVLLPLLSLAGKPWLLLGPMMDRPLGALSPLALVLGGLGVVGFIALLIGFRWFILQFLGDVAIYVSSNRLNRFYETRARIKQQCLDMANVIYGAIDERGEPMYQDVVVMGHSLGAVIAYDTLNAAINNDLADNERRGIARRTSCFITFGSPLDTTAFIFKVQTEADNDVRDELTGAVQPMLQSYRYRPARWINIFCRGDLIGSPLHYYDDDNATQGAGRRIINLKEPGWRDPVTAHTGYFRRKALGRTLRDAICTAHTAGATVRIPARPAAYATAGVVPPVVMRMAAWV